MRTRKEGLWVHYSLAPLEDAVMRVLMAAVTHSLCHCDVVAKDRRRLETQTGCCAPGTASSNLECCAPIKMQKVQTNRMNRVLTKFQFDDRHG